FSSSKAAFDVFLDELFEIPFKKATKDSNITSSAMQDRNKIESMPTFTTASGKAIKPPSEEAKKKAIKTLMDDDEEATIKVNAPTFGGFSTASGKPLKPLSEEAKLRALAILEDTDTVDNQSQPKEKEPQMMGFTTASGKTLKPLSEKAKKKAVALFREMDEETKSGIDSNNNLDIADKESSITSTNRGIQLASELLGKSGTKEPMDEKQQRQVFQQNKKRPSDEPLDIDFKYENENNDTPIKNTHEFNDKTNIPPAPRYNKRVSAMQKQNKPFKSPIIHSNIELTKAAIKNKSTSKPKTLPVFNLDGKMIMIHMFQSAFIYILYITSS
ncbi:MAG: hypothetical protein EXX96DRAFT_475252, partial [Benjaminiella poitrasii]